MANMAFTVDFADIQKTSTLFKIETALLFIAVIFLLIKYASTKHQRPLPPGPPRSFLINNMHQMPTSYPWRVFQKWHKIYGPIVSLQFGQRVMISIGSYKVAHDLLEKRKNIYDSRPHFVVSGEGISKGFLTIMLPTGTKWKMHRRLVSNFLSTRRTRSYRYLQDVESKQLLFNLLGSKDFSAEFRRFNLSIIMTLAYGKRIESSMNREIEDLTQIIHRQAAYLTRFGLLEAFPMLNRLPHWVAPWRKMGDLLFDIADKFFRNNMQYGQSSTSYNWARKICELKGGQGLPLKERSYILGILLEAGFETTTSILEYFTMVNVLYPESARKAQEELDSVVGQNRLPSFDDISNLPYVNAFIKEIIRWRPVLPLGVPHSPLKDDEYLGYRIPKDAIIVPNLIAMDDDSIHDPYEFRPERWFQHPDQPLRIFGFGRRTCPGQQMAQNSSFIAIARMLWGYNISYCYTNGKKIPIDSLDTAQIILAGPSPFEASFSIRSPEHQRIVEREWESTPTDVNTIMDHINLL
jgi:cytochrome P450